MRETFEQIAAGLPPELWQLMIVMLVFLVGVETFFGVLRFYQWWRDTR